MNAVNLIRAATWTGQAVVLCTPAAAPQTRDAARTIAPVHAAYDTELFNVPKPGKSLVDGKAHVDATFARSRAALLAKSADARAGEPQAGSAELDTLLARHCKKIKSDVVQLSAYDKYSCTPASAILAPY